MKYASTLFVILTVSFILFRYTQNVAQSEPLQGETKVYIKDSLVGKTTEEKAVIKSAEYEKIKKVPREKVQKESEPYEIEIIDTVAKGNTVEVFAKAWDKDGNQIGFGPDGSVEIERFVIQNPPILVADPAGDIVQTWTNDHTGLQESRTLREDPKQAMLEVIYHALSVKKQRFIHSNIQKDKVGNTTYVYYPDNDPETTTVDGQIKQGGGWIDTWANTRNSATAFNVSPSGTAAEFAGAFAFTSAGNWNEMYRSMFLFDSSGIPDSDTISSATFSIYVTSKADPHNEIDFMLGTSSPTSNTNLTTSDWDRSTKFGATRLASDIPYASITTSAYNNFTMNATGIANVSKTAVTKLSVQLAEDVDNTTPTWASGTYKHITGSFADFGGVGTTQDPTLTVEATGQATVTPRMVITGDAVLEGDVLSQ